MKVGKKVTLIINDKYYHSRVIDSNDQHTFLDLPINIQTRKTAFIRANKPLDVTYIGDDGACYSFTTKIIKRRLSHIPKLIINSPLNVKRIQRREFVRIKTAVDVALHSQTDVFTPFTTVTVDISGGGLSIILPSNNTLPLGNLIDVYLILHMQDGVTHYIETTAKILRTVKQSGELTTASLQFKSLTNQEQQFIVQFCLEIQREIRRKELQ